jgi:hypothetical protein
VRAPAIVEPRARHRRPPLTGHDHCWRCVAAAITSSCSPSVAIGLSLTSPYEGETAGLPRCGERARGGLQVSSFIVGASGRTSAAPVAASPHEVEVRDGAHGLLVWAPGCCWARCAASARRASTAASASPTATQAKPPPAQSPITRILWSVVDTLFWSASTRQCRRQCRGSRAHPRSHMAQGSISAEQLSGAAYRDAHRIASRGRAAYDKAI